MKKMTKGDGNLVEYIEKNGKNSAKVTKKMRKPILNIAFSHNICYYNN